MDSAPPLPFTPPLPRFCSHCGQHHALYLNEGHPHCGACGTTHWENDRPVAVMLLPIIREPGPQGEVRRGWFLITHTGNESDFAFPAGFVEMGESAEEAAVRELREETGVIYEGPVEVLRTQSTGKARLLIYCIAREALHFDDVRRMFSPTPEARGWTVERPVGWRHPMHGRIADEVRP